MKGKSPLFENGPKDGDQNKHSHSASLSNSPFDGNGHVTLQSISKNREHFLNKSIFQLQNELGQYGYITKIKDSKIEKSKAKILVITNNSSIRNIIQIQVSPGSQRHGMVPYVKISTSDYGRIKIIDADPADYKTDGIEKSHLLFRRK